MMLKTVEVPVSLLDKISKAAKMTFILFFCLKANKSAFIFALPHIFC
jgi:hypothetical protein